MISKTDNNSELKNLIIKTPVISKDSTIKEFINMMTKHRISLMPVVENGIVIGVVSEKDLIKLVKAQPIAGIQAIIIRDIPKDISKLTVSEIMTHRPITIRETSSIDQVIKTMTANNMKRLIVADENRKLIGLIQAKDVFKKLADA